MCYIGPLPTSESGNKYVLLIIDYFTKWPEAYSLPNQEATMVAEVVAKEYVCHYGVPLELHSDQGRNLEIKVFQEVCQLLGITKTRTTPLHPQSDGMVERMNRTLESQLSKFIDEHQQDWDHYVPFLMLALRSATHETTKCTPELCSNLGENCGYQLICCWEDRKKLRQPQITMKNCNKNWKKSILMQEQIFNSLLHK